MISTYKAAAERVSTAMKQFIRYRFCYFGRVDTAVIAQLGERKTEDLKVSGSIPDCGNRFDKSTFYENNTFAFDY